MSTEYGLLITVEAAAGRHDDVAHFLRDQLKVVQAESGTATWYSYRITDALFGVYATFADDDARRAHLDGEFVAGLTASPGTPSPGHRASRSSASSRASAEPSTPPPDRRRPLSP